MSQPLSYLIAALMIGACAEQMARSLRLWRYRRSYFAVLNVLVVFGLLQGLGVAWTIGGRQDLAQIAPVLFMAGAVLGIAVEGVNQYWLGAWTWPERPFVGITRPIDKSAFVGVLWGFVPVFTGTIAHLLRQLWKLG